MTSRSSVFYRDLNNPPPEIRRGEGCYIEDVAGRRYLDASANAGVVAIGHGRSEIARALAQAGDSVTFVYNANFTHRWQEELARAILSLAPGNMAGVYFVSSGSEANESAWKLARQYHVERGRAGKYKAIARRQSFHGVTLAALSLSGRPSWRRIYEPLLLPVTQIAPPHELRCAYCGDCAGCTLQCADELDEAIRREGPDTVAAFFAEPVVGTSTAGLVPHAHYYRRIREICDRHDVLFVADEVLCGYGRTGYPFAIAAWNVEPDIVTMGKALASGYAPLAAMVVSEKVRAAFTGGSGRFVHGLTYSGTPAACFIGLKVFEIMQRESLSQRSAEAGATLMKELEALAKKHAIIGEVRGRGLLIGIELVADRATHTPFPESAQMTQRVVKALRARNVLVAGGMAEVGPHRLGDHIQLSPPYIIGPAEISALVAALDASLVELT